MARKQRSDTAAGTVAAFQNAVVQIQPPAAVRLRDGDRPYWDSVVRARAANEWSEPDLMHAANLARCLHDIERISGEISVEGDVLENARGTPVVNPKHTILETLSRRCVALTRLLHMHAEARQKASDVAKGRKTTDAVSAVVADLDDDLLARPGMQ